MKNYSETGTTKGNPFLVILSPDAGLAVCGANGQAFRITVE